MKKETYEERKQLGICLCCGKGKSHKGNTQCLTCKQHQANLQQVRYAAVKKAKVCWSCLKPLQPYSRLTECKPCRVKRKDFRVSIYWGRALRDVCVDCETPTMQGRKRCDDCAQVRNAQQRDRTAHRIKENRCTGCATRLMTSQYRTCDRCRAKRVKNHYFNKHVYNESPTISA